ncbi:hypothetical protein DM02DRAFT_661244 [Periconia macrospinosa]|uniref:Uncharacterized protein n=1 Tax=Periconia macrospinosa TaxID=97972 RepID=A0A2V1D7Z4_9PLEO|nr:hypothetical protein DM02DRAFT_661244 [Periconia macrospinosa]
MASTAEPNRTPEYDPKNPRIADTPITWENWYKHVNWLNIFLIIGAPMMGLISDAFNIQYSI